MNNNLKASAILPVTSVLVAALSSAFMMPAKHTFTTTTYFIQTVNGTQTLVASQTIPATGWNTTTTQPSDIWCIGTAHTCFVAVKISIRRTKIVAVIVPGIFVC